MSRSDRRKSRRGRRRMGGLAGAILLVIVMALIVTGASMATPYMGKQELRAGDYFVYSVSETTAGSTETGTLTVTVYAAVGNAVAYVFANSVGPSMNIQIPTVTHSGNMLYMATPFMVPMFADRAWVEGWSGLQQSTSVSLSGYTPMLVEKLVGSDGGDPCTLMVKMGTNLVVQGEVESGGTTYRMQLVDSNVLWAKAL